MSNPQDDFMFRSSSEDLRKGKRGSHKQADEAAARLRKATEAVQARILASMDGHEDNATNAAPNASRTRSTPSTSPAESASQTAAAARQYPYDRPSSKLPNSAQSHTGSSGSTAAAGPGGGVSSILEQAKQAAKAAQPAAMAKAAAEREREAKILREMFQAVWPDLGSFRAWSSTTKVVAMSGSLSLSLAFFGFVYYMSSKYDRMKSKEDRAPEPSK